MKCKVTLAKTTQKTPTKAWFICTERLGQAAQQKEIREHLLLVMFCMCYYYSLFFTSRRTGCRLNIELYLVMHQYHTYRASGSKMEKWIMLQGWLHKFLWTFLILFFYSENNLNPLLHHKFSHSSTLGSKNILQPNQPAIIILIVILCDTNFDFVLNVFKVSIK